MNDTYFESSEMGYSTGKTGSLSWNRDFDSFGIQLIKTNKRKGGKGREKD